MCGINGIFGIEELSNVRETIEQMNEKIRHRGPDFGDSYIDDKIALGHRRLSIIDLSDHANQPFHSTDNRYVMVFNGEIYNYEEIKSQLDYPFQTNSDSEVLLAAFIRWGSNCLDQLNGMFAFAIWDKVQQELFVARDRMGIKPLYFFRNNKQIIFSSEIRGILASNLVPKKLSEEGLVDYLRYQTVHAPKTIIEGVEMLPSGTFMKIKDQEISVQKYWSQGRNQDRNVSSNLAEIHKGIKDRFLTAVDLRMKSDVPFGAFLSGGIDSSLIVSAMHEVKPNKINTFSVSFQEKEFSEAKYAELIAQKYNTNHHDIVLKPDDFLQKLPLSLQAMDHPSGDGPNTYVVSEVTKKSGITVALSGLGGDELFAGYDIFQRSLSLENNKWAMSFPKTIRGIAGKALKLLKPSVASNKIHEILKLDYWDLEYTYQLNRQSLLDGQIKELTTLSKFPINRVFDIVKEGIDVGKEGYNLPFLSKVSYAEMNTYMQNVLLRDSDQMSMAHALEIRVPFLDHHLVEYAMGISDKDKFPSSPKKILVDAMSGALPDELVNRPKMGFVLPWKEWMKKELKKLVHSNIEELAERKPFNSVGILNLLRNFEQENSTVSWSRIWSLVVLNHWLKENEINA